MIRAPKYFVPALVKPCVHSCVGHDEVGPWPESASTRTVPALTRWPLFSLARSEHEVRVSGSGQGLTGDGLDLVRREGPAVTLAQTSYLPSKFGVTIWARCGCHRIDKPVRDKREAVVCNRV